MPPLIIEEDSGGEIPYKGKAAAKAAAKEESEDEGDGDEEEYVIESIKNHDWNDFGEVVYEVKWEGYDDPADMTWEPEENLESAKETLSAYWKSIGGKPSKREPSKKGKKRKADDTVATKGRQTKRGRSETPEVKSKARGGDKELKLPKGSWEKEVAGIDTIEEAVDEKGELQRYVYVMWNSGDKTRHSLSTVNEKCPQKMLRYYESHLVFRSPEAGANGDAMT